MAESRFDYDIIEKAEAEEELTERRKRGSMFDTLSDDLRLLEMTRRRAIVVEFPKYYDVANLRNYVKSRGFDKVVIKSSKTLRDTYKAFIFNENAIKK